MPLEGRGGGAKAGGGLNVTRTRPDVAALKHTLRQRPRRVQVSQREGSDERALRTEPFPCTDQWKHKARDLPNCPFALALSREADNRENRPAISSCKHFHFHLKQMKQTAFPFLNIALISAPSFWKCSLGLKRALSFSLHLYR